MKASKKALLLLVVAVFHPESKANSTKDDSTARREDTVSSKPIFFSQLSRLREAASNRSTSAEASKTNTTTKGSQLPDVVTHSPSRLAEILKSPPSGRYRTFSPPDVVYGFQPSVPYNVRYRPTSSEHQPVNEVNVRNRYKVTRNPPDKNQQAETADANSDEPAPPPANDKDEQVYYVERPPQNPDQDQQESDSNDKQREPDTYGYPVTGDSENYFQPQRYPGYNDNIYDSDLMNSATAGSYYPFRGPVRHFGRPSYFRHRLQPSASLSHPSHFAFRPFTHSHGGHLSSLGFQMSPFAFSGHHGMDFMT